ncbi:MAG: VWA domain-containing protein [Methylomonas sp.]|jgi:hypothetical protein|uniref:VWA domain-containing protein n=1 Tax=Methylomonas sp. TaxID=418 RepID=UPI0025E6EC85|nr:VWA domain-containing protein [Methylomonas sp.]MCK9607049.1 VWA domain-containing protein [Methylomonas sp.]
MSLVLRITIMLLLAAAVWNPRIPWGEGPVDLLLLVDDSYSMNGKLGSTVWPQVRDLVRNLPKHSRVALIRYGKQPVLELPPTDIDEPQLVALLDSELPLRQVTLDRSASNLEQAMVFAARLIAPKRATTLLIIHDDQQTSGDASAIIQWLKEQGLQLIQLNVASPTAAPDAWIQSLKVPFYAEVDRPLPVTVTVGGNHDAAVMLNLYINDQLQLRQSLQVVPGEPALLQFEMAGCSVDVCLIKAQLEADNDAIPQNNQRQQATTVDKAKPILYIGHKKGPSAIFTTLTASGVALNAMHPDLCMSTSEQLKPYAAIILDDIASGMMPDSCWNALTQAVSNFGVGLIVLGGPNSFAAGSYRHSVLEDLLPVTAEASKQQEAISLLFMIDKSGSMASDGGDPSRIAMARQAVIESMSAQGEQDAFGLISFDAKPHLHIPIMHHDDPVAEIREAFNVQANGGTRLKPALDFAIQELDKRRAGKRMLVLLSDGFLDEQDMAAVERKIVEQKITLITLAIGNNAETEKLRRLTQHNDGKLLGVDRMIELPMLLRKELDQRRDPVTKGAILVNQQIPLPFMGDGTGWPDLSAYMVTKAKPDSIVYLESASRDPLLAMRYAGIGKVIALPAGLEGWAENWLGWQEWSRFAHGLIRWSSMSNRHPQVNIGILTVSGKSQLHADVLTPDRIWQVNESGKMTVTDPHGQIHSQTLNMSAPGHYIGDLSMDKEGLYTIGARIGTLNTSLNIYNQALGEYMPLDILMANKPVLSKLIPDGGGINDVNNRQMIHIRGVFLGCAALLYLALILLANEFYFHIISSHLLSLIRRCRYL